MERPHYKKERPQLCARDRVVRDGAERKPPGGDPRLRNRGQGRPPRRFAGRSARWLSLARDVIEQSGPEAPADRVLKEILKGAQELTVAGRREAAQAVFQYYRWLGWLGEESGITKRILRARELAERYEGTPSGFSDLELQQRTVPAWVWQEMSADVSWCRMLQRPPVLWLRARPGQREELARELGRCVLGPPGLPDALRYDGTEDIFRSPAFTNGRVEIQDLSSQAVGRMCGVRSGQHWWDVCAGEGGKTLHLASIMEGRGVVWATDRSTWRLGRLKRRAARAEVFNYQAYRWSLGEPVPFTVKVDGALVDAPCSGLGTWQRNPHGRWTVRPSDVEELAKLQQDFLRVAADQVKPGGRLVYSVCTMARRETTEVVRAFERSRSDFEPLDVVHALEAARKGSRHWVKPWEAGGNGMFVAVWRRQR